MWPCIRAHTAVTSPRATAQLYTSGFLTICSFSVWVQIRRSSTVRVRGMHAAAAMHAVRFRHDIKGAQDCLQALRYGGEHACRIIV